MRFKPPTKFSAPFILSFTALFIISSFKYYTPGDLVAIEFINSLNDEQRNSIVLKFDNESREEWTYLPISSSRDGLLIRNLNNEQRNLFQN